MSKRIRAAGVLCATTVSVLLGAGAAQADSSHQQMTGAVKQGDSINAISAHGVEADAKGQFNASGLFHAQVTCLEVTGNTAVATAVIDHSNDPLNPVGEVIVIRGVDNGNPSDGVSPDLFRVSFEGNGGLQPGSGPCRQDFLPPAPVDSGNIVVMPG